MQETEAPKAQKADDTELFRSNAKAPAHTLQYDEPPRAAYIFPHGFEAIKSQYAFELDPVASVGTKRLLSTALILDIYPLALVLKFSGNSPAAIMPDGAVVG